MNLFRLHENPITAAIYNQDLHVRKIILEAAGLLCNAYPESKLLEAPKTQLGQSRRHSWYNHPLSLWTRENDKNFKWLLCHLRSLHLEYNYRWNKIHFTFPLLQWFYLNRPELPVSKKQTVQPQCFGKFKDSCYVENNPVQGYRNYYNAAKLTFDIRGKIVHAKWTGRDMPEFIQK